MMTAIPPENDGVHTLIISDHACERMHERCPHMVPPQYLRDYENGFPNRMKSWIRAAVLSSPKLDDSYVRVAGRMVYGLRLRGTHAYRHHGDAVFVVSTEGFRSVVVTVMDLDLVAQSLAAAPPRPRPRKWYQRMQCA